MTFFQETASPQSVIEAELGAGGDLQLEVVDSVLTPSPAEPAAERGPFRRLTRRPGVVVALVYLGVITLMAIFAPLVTSQDPNAIDPVNRFAGPSASHWLGTDDLGRDIYTRLVYGARVSLVTCFAVIAIAMLIALVFGLLAGYFGGKVDNVFMRLIDAGMSIPPLVLAVAVAGVLGPGVVNVIVALTIVSVFGLTRLVRGETLAVREAAFVEASRVSGTRARNILLRRVLPNIRSSLIVAGTFGLGFILVVESGLAFLGLGPRPPAPSWGGMLRNSYDRALNIAPWQLLVPCAAIAFTIFAFNVVGDGLRDVLGTGRVTKGRRSERRGLTTVTRNEPLSNPVDDALLRIEGLSVEFTGEGGPQRVVDDVSLTIRPGEIVGLVGESGSGKSVTSLSVMRLVPSPPGHIVTGSIWFDGVDLLAQPFKQIRSIRGSQISMVFQDPMTNIDPSFTIGSALYEAQRLHRSISRSAARERSIDLLELVGVPAPSVRVRQYPHELSGGLRQRVMLAMALANDPKLLIADEPTTALDVTVQAQILDLLRKLRAELGMAVLFVTHDLGVVADLCDRVAVMYAGQIVEEAPVVELFDRPRHPYTAGLLGAMPQVGGLGDRLTVIPGRVPLPHEMPVGCRFAQRCSHAVDACRRGPVPLTLTSVGDVRCVRADELSLRGAQ